MMTQRSDMLLRVLIVLVILVVAVSYARAHSWYEFECCSDKDCEALPPESVKETNNGYLLPNGQTIPYNMARQSRDRDYHWCRLGEDIRQPTGKAYCFYAPSFGT